MNKSNKSVSSTLSHYSFELLFRSAKDGLLLWHGRLQDDLIGDMMSVGLYNGYINVR